MTNVRWTWGGGGGGGGRGPITKTTHLIICSSSLPLLWTPDLSMIKTTRLDQQEACFQVIMCTYLNIGSSPCTSTLCPLILSMLLGLPIFCRSSTHVYYCKRKKKAKTGEAWERGYHTVQYNHIAVFCHMMHYITV